MRRLDVQDFFGYLPMPEVEGGMYLIDVLFRVGPVRGEMPLVEADLEPWERRRGIVLQPWQAELILDMSQEYMQQMHKAREIGALSPWEPARKMWMDVTGAKAQQEADAHKAAETRRRERELNGSHKRH